MLIPSTICPAYKTYIHPIAYSTQFMRQHLFLMSSLAISPCQGTSQSRLLTQPIEGRNETERILFVKVHRKNRRWRSVSRLGLHTDVQIYSNRSHRFLTCYRRHTCDRIRQLQVTIKSWNVLSHKAVCRRYRASGQVSDWGQIRVWNCTRLMSLFRCASIASPW